jgi:hypothetical protein
MLVADPAEADKIYLELKKRAMRTARAKAKEDQISSALADEEDVD